MLKYLRSSLLCMILGLGIVPATVFAAETVTIPVSADTMVKYSSPDTSYGGESVLDVLYEGGESLATTPNEVAETLLQFPLDQLPTGKIVTKAELILSARGTSQFGYGDIRIRRILSAWDEAVTWQNRPSYTQQSYANIEVENNQPPVAIDITSLVREWYTGGAVNHGLLIRAFGDGNYDYGFFTGHDVHLASREGGSPAQLRVTYDDAPAGGAADTSSGGQSSEGGSTSTHTPQPGTEAHENASVDGVSNSSSPVPADSVGTSTNTDGNKGTTGGTTELVEACLPGIVSIQHRLFDTDAHVTISIRDAAMVSLYLYDVTRTGNESSRQAVDYETGSRSFHSAAANDHTFRLGGLTPGKSYFYTLLVGDEQECEHSFALGSGTGASVIQSAQKDDAAERLSELGAQAPSLSVAFPIVSLTRQVWSTLTSGKALSWVWSPLFALLLAMPVFYGKSTLKRARRLYQAWRSLPSWWYVITHRPQRGATWGRVLSSVNFVPVHGAIVSLYDDKRVVETSLTNEQGVYGFVTLPGTYTLSVSHAGYNYPSQMQGEGYTGEPFTIEVENQPVEYDLYMDPCYLLSSRFRALEQFLFSAATFRPYILVATTLVWIGSLLSPILLHLFVGVVLVTLWRYELKHRRDVFYCFTLIDNGKLIVGMPIHFLDRRGHILLRKIANQKGQVCVQLPPGRYTVEMVSRSESFARVTRLRQDVALIPGRQLKRETLHLEKRTDVSS